MLSPDHQTWYPGLRNVPRRLSYGRMGRGLARPRHPPSSRGRNQIARARSPPSRQRALSSSQQPSTSACSTHRLAPTLGQGRKEHVASNSHQKSIGEVRRGNRQTHPQGRFCCLALGFSRRGGGDRSPSLPGLKVGVSAVTLPIVAAAPAVLARRVLQALRPALQVSSRCFASHALNNQSLLIATGRRQRKAAISPKKKPHKGLAAKRVREGKGKLRADQSKQRELKRRVAPRLCAFRAQVACYSRAGQQEVRKGPQPRQGPRPQRRKALLKRRHGELIAYALDTGGVAEVRPSLFQPDRRFSDISYQSARRGKSRSSPRWSSLYNYFPAESGVQLTIVNTRSREGSSGEGVLRGPNDKGVPWATRRRVQSILNDKMREGRVEISSAGASSTLLGACRGVEVADAQALAHQTVGHRVDLGRIRCAWRPLQR